MNKPMATNAAPSTKDLLLAQASRDALLLKGQAEHSSRLDAHSKKLDDLLKRVAKFLDVPQPAGGAPVIKK